MDRRQFIMAIAAGASYAHVSRLWGAEQPPQNYQPANTDWLAGSRYGIGVHWTAQTVPREGQPLPFQKAVDAFDVKKFIDALVYAGAEYLLFTVSGQRPARTVSPVPWSTSPPDRSSRASDA